jgi:hypothetical protein
MAEVILFFPKLKKDEPSALLPLNLLVVAAPLVEKEVAGYGSGACSGRVKKVEC